MEKNENIELIRKHVDIIILKPLLERDCYGYEILKSIEDNSNGLYSLKQPTLYSCLKRLEHQKKITSYTGNISQGAQRRYYSLTNFGREHVKKYQKEWEYTRTILSLLISDKDFDKHTEEPPFVASELRPLTRRIKDSQIFEQIESLPKYSNVKNEENVELDTYTIEKEINDDKNITTCEHAESYTKDETLNEFILDSANAHTVSQDELNELLQNTEEQEEEINKFDVNQADIESHNERAIQESLDTVIGSELSSSEADRYVVGDNVKDTLDLHEKEIEEKSVEEDEHFSADDDIETISQEISELEENLEEEVENEDLDENIDDSEEEVDEYAEFSVISYETKEQDKNSEEENSIDNDSTAEDKEDSVEEEIAEEEETNNSPSQEVINSENSTNDNDINPRDNAFSADDDIDTITKESLDEEGSKSSNEEIASENDVVKENIEKDTTVVEETIEQPVINIEQETTSTQPNEEPVVEEKESAPAVVQQNEEIQVKEEQPAPVVQEPKQEVKQETKEDDDARKSYFDDYQAKIEFYRKQFGYSNKDKDSKK